MPGTVLIPTPVTYAAVVGGPIATYATLSAACAAEPAGTVITVAPGTIVEVADIVVKAGQSIVAWGGVDNGPSVRVNMGNFKLTAAVNSVIIDGIYFYWSATVDQSHFNITGNNCAVRNLTLDFTPTVGSVHRGLLLQGSGHVVSDIRILADADTYRAIECNAMTDSSVGRIYLSGGKTTVVAGQEYLVRIVGSQRNHYRDITITTPAATIQTGALVGVTTAAAKDGDLFDSISIIHSANNAASGNGVYYYDTAGALVYFHDSWTNLQIKNCYDGIRIVRAADVKFVNCTIGTELAKCGDSSIFEATESLALTFNTVWAWAVGTTANFAALAAVTTLIGCRLYTDGATNLSIVGTRPAIIGCFLPNGVTLLSCTSMRVDGCQIGGTFSVDNTLDGSIVNCAANILSIGPANSTSYINISGCTITTLTNGAFATGTRIGACTITAFTDSGHDTVRDIYTPETLAGATPVRGSRDYDNTGAVGGNTITLPDPAAVTVSVGYRFRVTIMVNQLITIAQPALQVVKVNGFSSTPGVGGSCQSNIQWSTLELTYKGGNNWVATAAIGGWLLV